jgi:hypothetical protein
VSATAMRGKVKSNTNLRNLVKLLGGDNKIVTPRLTQFLLDNEDGVTYEPWVIERVMQEATRKKRYRPGTFSASSAGDCPRAQVLAFLGMPARKRVDVKLQNMGNDGTWRHLRYQANLLQAEIIDDIEFPLPWPKMRSHGTIDGIGHVPLDHPRVEWAGKPYLLELKGAFSFKAMRIGVEGPEVYKPQVWRYMLVSGINLASILVENRDSLEWTEYVYEAEAANLAASRRDLQLLNDAVDTKTLPKRLRECEQRTGSTYKYCPFGGREDSPCIATDRWPTITTK